MNNCRVDAEVTLWGKCIPYLQSSKRKCLNVSGGEFDRDYVCSVSTDLKSRENPGIEEVELNPAIEEVRVNPGIEEVGVNPRIEKFKEKSRHSVGGQGK